MLPCCMLGFRRVVVLRNQSFNIWQWKSGHVFPLGIDARSHSGLCSLVSLRRLGFWTNSGSGYRSERESDLSSTGQLHDAANTRRRRCSTGQPVSDSGLPRHFALCGPGISRRTGSGLSATCLSPSRCSCASLPTSSAGCSGNGSARCRGFALRWCGCSTVSGTVRCPQSGDGSRTNGRTRCCGSYRLLSLSDGSVLPILSGRLLELLWGTWEVLQQFEMRLPLWLLLALQKVGDCPSGGCSRESRSDATPTEFHGAHRGFRNSGERSTAAGVQPSGRRPDLRRQVRWQVQ